MLAKSRRFEPQTDTYLNSLWFPASLHFTYTIYIPYVLATDSCLLEIAVMVDESLPFIGTYSYWMASINKKSVFNQYIPALFILTQLTYNLHEYYNIYTVKAGIVSILKEAQEL